MVMGDVSERRSSPWARALRAVHTPLQMSGELIGTFGTSGRQAQWIKRPRREE